MYLELFDHFRVRRLDEPQKWQRGCYSGLVSRNEVAQHRNRVTSADHRQNVHKEAHCFGTLLFTVQTAFAFAVEFIQSLQTFFLQLSHLTDQLREVHSAQFDCFFRPEDDFDQFFDL